MPRKLKLKPEKQLLAENIDLRARLDEAEETLRAIRGGEVDALTVSGVGGEQLFTLTGADHIYRVLIEDMSEGALTLTAEGMIVYANRRFAEMLKTPLEKVIGSPIHTWIAPDSQGTLQSLLSNDVDEKRRGQLVLSTNDGTLVPVYLSVSNLHINAMPTSFCLVATDLTEQKRNDSIAASEKLARELLAASNQSRLELLSMVENQKRVEEALRGSEERYRQIIETAREGIWTIDALDRTTLANQHLADMLGYTVKEMLGKSIFEFMDEEGKAIFTTNAENRRQGINEQFDFKYKHKDGSNVWALISSSPLLGHNHQYMGALAMVTDITERKHAEEKIRRQLEHLTALSAIDRVIAANFDLKLSLSEILNHVTIELGVDATDILLLNSNSQKLELAALSGFRTKSIKNTQLRLGESFAGRAALERRLVQSQNLSKEADTSLLSTIAADEGFVCYFGVPLINKGQVKGVLEIFHRSTLDPDAEWFDFLNALAGQAAIAIENSSLFERLQRSNSELTMAYDATIEGWSHALDLRDKETEGHTQRVTEMTANLALAFDLSKAELVQVRWGALLHDIGKMGIPDGILLKPGPLTDEEWVVMKRHPVLAFEMLSPIRYLHGSLDIPYCHHEKWDGEGYPRGLIGEQIPFTARIFAVVDVYDALTSDRPYRKAWSKEKAFEYIKSSSGTHFDPQVVKKFFLEYG